MKKAPVPNFLSSPRGSGALSGQGSVGTPGVIGTGAKILETITPTPRLPQDSSWFSSHPILPAADSSALQAPSSWASDPPPFPNHLEGASSQKAPQPVLRDPCSAFRPPQWMQNYTFCPYTKGS